MNFPPTPIIVLHPLQHTVHLLSEWSSLIMPSCGYCGKRYQYKQSLSRHRATAHKAELAKEKQSGGAKNSTIVCREETCTFKAMSVSDLRAHLTGAHQKTFTIVDKQFANWQGTRRPHVSFPTRASVDNVHVHVTKRVCNWSAECRPPNRFSKTCLRYEVLL